MDNPNSPQGGTSNPQHDLDIPEHAGQSAPGQGDRDGSQAAERETSNQGQRDRAERRDQNERVNRDTAGQDAGGQEIDSTGSTR